jgi:hypothetical protein
VLVFPAAVLAVHQLRYMLAYGSHAGAELSAHGDRYIATAAVIGGMLVMLSLGLGALRLLATSRGRRRTETEIGQAPLWVLWLGLTALLLVGFCALEGLEMVFEPGHADGIASIFGSGGWWALPAAAFVGAVMALLIRGGRVLLVIAGRARRSTRVRADAARRRPTLGAVLPLRPMATCAAGRAPPALRLS